MTREGGCLCGGLRYAVDGEPRETVHCHCRMCQKSSGAAFLTLATFSKSAFRYTAGAPAIFRSSEHAQREFCGTCGSQIIFRAERLSTLDITVTTLDDPDAIAPVANTWVGSRLSWLSGFDAGLTDIPGEWPGDET